MTPSRRLLVEELKTIVSDHDQQVDPLVAFTNYSYYLVEAAKEAVQSDDNDREQVLLALIDRCDAVIEIMKEAEAKLIQKLDEEGFPEFATAYQERCYRSLVDND
jgi:hypothetical protein